MITNFLERKDATGVQKHVYEDFFGPVTPEETITASEELKVSLKRVFGSELAKLDHYDAIEGVIQDECIFNAKDVKGNLKFLELFTQAISNIYQGYLGTIGNDVSAETINATSAKFCISSIGKGTYKEIKMTLNDLGEISEYINGSPITLKHYKEILRLAKSINEIETSIRNTKDRESATNLKKTSMEYYKQLTDYYQDVVLGFFKIVEDKSGVAIDEIVNITVVFDNTIKSVDGTGTANIVSFVSMHSAYNVLKRELKDSIL